MGSMFGLHSFISGQYLGSIIWSFGGFLLLVFVFVFVFVGDCFQSVGLRRIFFSPRQGGRGGGVSGRSALLLTMGGVAHIYKYVYAVFFHHLTALAFASIGRTPRFSMESGVGGGGWGSGMPSRLIGVHQFTRHMCQGCAGNTVHHPPPPLVGMIV